MQVFGSYYYGFYERGDTKSLRNIAYLADSMDMNDFLFSNSPYTLTYIRPSARGLEEVLSTSPPSPPITLDSPTDAPRRVRLQMESSGPQCSDNPGVEGINQFGTNAFQIQTWYSAPLPAMPDAAVLVEDIESDTDWEAQQQREREREQEKAQEGGWDDVNVQEPASAAERVTSEDDVLVEGETGSKEKLPISVPIVDLSSEDEFDKARSSDEDEDDDISRKLRETKPVILPSGNVKTEKGYWQQQEKLRAEQRAKRIKRKEERDATARRLAAAEESNELQKKQFAELQAQMNFIMQQMNTTSGTLPVPSEPTAPLPDVPDVSSSDALEVSRLVGNLPDPRVEDTNRAGPPPAQAVTGPGAETALPTCQTSRQESGDDKAPPPAISGGHEGGEHDRTQRDVVSEQEKSDDPVVKSPQVIHYFPFGD